MTTPTTGITASSNRVADTRTSDVRPVRPRGEETKPSWKSTELWIYLAAVVGVLIASQAVGDGARNDGNDIFAADKAWWYVTLLTVGYLVSRGLAKAGSRTRDDDPRTH